MFRAREVTILEQSMIDGGIDTSTGIGRYFLQKLQEAGYSQDELDEFKVSPYFNEAGVLYMATLGIGIDSSTIAGVWRRGSDGTGQRSKWRIEIDGKRGRDFDYDESNIFSQYDLAGKYISDV